MRNTRERNRAAGDANACLTRCCNLKLRVSVVAAVVTLSLVGCKHSSSGTEVDFALIYGIVYGRVLTPTGIPVAGVTVRADVDISQATCQTGAGGFSGGQAVVSDSAGRYRQIVTAPLLPKTMCVFVKVPPQAGIPSSPLTITGNFHLRMAPADQTRDSIQVDIRLL